MYLSLYIHFLVLVILNENIFEQYEIFLNTLKISQIRTVDDSYLANEKCGMTGLIFFSPDL